MFRLEQACKRALGKFRGSRKDDAHGNSGVDHQFGTSRGTGDESRPMRGHCAPSGALPELLGELGPYALLLQLREVFDEHLAPQMIHLVLQAHG